jgi:hypothetical protein
VASGRWTPGSYQDSPDKPSPTIVLEDLFNVTPPATDQPGRNQMQYGDTLYAVVFRRLLKQST